MDQALINTAIESLELLTIKLHSSKLERADNFVLGELDVEFGFQYLKTVYSETYDAVTEDESHYQMLRVFPKFGVRGVSPKITKKKGKGAGTPDVFFTLEALFRADYLIKKPLSDEAIKEFSMHNAIHNVWPFWRQYVFDMAARADLPSISIPLFTVTQSKPEEKK